MGKQYPPNPEWLAQAQCIGKHRFDDGGLAKQVARKSSQRKDSKASAYRCVTCGGWHVGNGNGKQQNRRKK